MNGKLTLFVSILFLLQLISCASMNEKGTREEKLAQIDKLVEEDFSPVEEVRYDSRNDYHLGLKPVSENLLAQESIDFLGEDIWTDLDSGDDSLSSALSLCLLKKYNEGIQILKRDFLANKKNPRYWNIVGSCYYAKSHFRMASLYFNKAIELKPDYAVGLNNLALVEKKQHNLQKALEYLEKAAMTSPFSLTPTFNLVNLYMEYGLLDRAGSRLKVMESKAPKDPYVINALAHYHLFLNNLNKSIGYFKLIENDFGSKPQVGINMALAYFLSKNRPKALEVFTQINTGTLGSLQSYYREVARLIGFKR